MKEEERERERKKISLSQIFQTKKKEVNLKNFQNLIFILKYKWKYHLYLYV